MKDPLIEMVRSDPRRAGDVDRYSTWMVSVRQQNGSHTWQVMRILSTIWPEVPADAMIFALHHDSGELGSGDIPYPHKQNDPGLKAKMDNLEAKSLRDQGLRVPVPADPWRQRIKTCDLIEMLEKGMDEVLIGSVYGIPIVQRMQEQLKSRTHASDDDENRVKLYLAERWRRFNLTRRQLMDFMLGDDG